ncbi:MAG TPA: carbohydrate porin [Geobacteraceae bacterium]|nr:carbohydrate porin [Geobacteraceae bacterium]
MKKGNPCIPRERFGTAEQFVTPDRGGGSLQKSMKIVPSPSKRRLGNICACLVFLMLLPATVLAQSAENVVTGTTGAESSARSAQGDPAAPPAAAASAVSISPELAVNPRALSGAYYSGLLQKTLGLSPDFPIRFGGILDVGGNWVASGGLSPHTLSGDFVFGLNVDVDAERLLHIPGGRFFAGCLVYQGMDGNGRVGSVQVFDNLAPPKDFHRVQLYELWWRQRLFDNKLIFKIGKINAGGEFGQVLNPATALEPHMRDWTISDLLYTPSGLHTTNFKLPIYPNPAWGLSLTFLPTKNFYVSYGLFDGNGARGVQTGVEVGPEFNGYWFHIGEVGYAWRLGAQGKSGRFAAGIWGQTGALATGNLNSDKTAAVMTNGAMGYYAFASQRLWYRNPASDPTGLIGFAQLGYSDSPSNSANWYVGGGLTALGLVPGRPGDTAGIGLAWSKLNSGAYAGLFFFPNVPSSYTSTSLRSSELMLQAYYQMNLIPSYVALQAAYTAIPTPGYRAGIPWANIFTLRMVLVL